MLSDVQLEEFARNGIVRIPGAFAAEDAARMRDALDQLFGRAGWTEPAHLGQVPVTLPTGEPWSVPHRQWHTDVGFESLPQDELNTTPERDFTIVRDQVLASHPWFLHLTSEDRPSTTDLMTETDLDGIPVRVVELTGQAGDVYLTHPWVLHSIAPNASDTPRMMRSRMIWQTNWPR